MDEWQSEWVLQLNTSQKYLKQLNTYRKYLKDIAQHISKISQTAHTYQKYLNTSRKYLTQLNKSLTITLKGKAVLRVLNLNFWGLGWPWGSDKEVR